MLTPVLLLSSATAFAAPDLVIRNVEVPIVAVAGASVDVRFRATSRAETADFEYAIVFSPRATAADSSVWARGVAHGAANVELELVERVSVPEGFVGRGYFGVVVDPDDRILELNELDNVRFGATRTRVRAQTADLVIDSVRVAESSAAPGDQIHVDLTLRNAGELPAAFRSSIHLSSNTALSTDDLLIATADDVQLEANESLTLRVNATVPAGARAGDYYVGAILDPDLAVPETHEGDARLATLPLNVRIATLSLDTLDLPAGTVFIPYYARLLATGGDGHHRFRVAGGRLPDGLNLDSTGVLAGNPLDSGTFELDVSVASVGLTALRHYSIQVAQSGVALVIATPDLEVGTVSLPYHLELVAAGGEPPYAWDAPELPTGLDLTPSGILTGIPILQGTYHLEIRVSDAIGNEDTKEFELLVESPNVVVESGDVGPVEVGVETDIELRISGGKPPYRVIPLSTPPPGLSITEDGHLVGIATEVGTFPVRVRANDSSGVAATDTGIVFVQVIPSGTFQIATLDPPEAIIRRLYSFQLDVLGGVEPISWRLAPGESLPDGFSLELSETAPRRSVVLKGISVRPGTSPFTLIAQDATGRRTEAVLALTVVRPDTQVSSGGCATTEGQVSLLALALLAMIRKRRT